MVVEDASVVRERADAAVMVDACRVMHDELSTMVEGAQLCATDMHARLELCSPRCMVYSPPTYTMCPVYVTGLNGVYIYGSGWVGNISIRA